MDRTKKWDLWHLVPYPLYECSHRGCYESRLRYDPEEGTWCRAHYTGAPRCSKCKKDRPAISPRDSGEERLCRDCWQNTFTGSIDLKRVSAIGWGDVPGTILPSSRIKNVKPELAENKDSKPEGVCHSGERGWVHVFAPGKSGCQCGHHVSMGRRPRRRCNGYCYKRHPRAQSPTPA